MAYCVTKTYGNGYRCGCCRRDWDRDPEWFDTREEALAEVPTSHPGPSDVELTAVKVVDGSTGETIAEGELHTTGGRRYGYERQAWIGNKEGGRFEHVVGGNPGETWSELVQRTNQEIAQEHLRKAEAEAKEAATRLAKLKERG